MRRFMIYSFLIVLIVGFTRGRVSADLDCMADMSCFINIDHSLGGDWDLFSGPVSILHNPPYTGLVTPVFIYDGHYFYESGSLIDGEVMTAHYVLDTPCVLDGYYLHTNTAMFTDSYASLDIKQGGVWTTLVSAYTTSPALGGPGVVDTYEGSITGDAVEEIQVQVTATENHAQLWKLFFSSSEDCEPAPPAFTRPLTSDDEAETDALYDQIEAFNDPVSLELYPVLNNGGIQTVSGWSQAPGANVHAADAGTIVDVKPLSWDDCGIAYASPTSVEDDTTVYVPFAAEQNQPCVVGRFLSSAENHRNPPTYWLDASDVYIVTLQIGDGRKIQYLVRNAPHYVIEGDTVTAGCVLGETIPLTTIPAQAINFTGISAVAGLASLFSGGATSLVFGLIAGGSSLINSFTPPPAPGGLGLGYMTMTAYEEDDSLSELASQLTIEPTNEDKCMGTGQYSNCLLDNPTLSESGSGWVASGNVEWLEPGVALDPLEQISTTLNLDPDGDYTVTAFAEGQNGTESEIRIALGNNTQRLAVPVEWTSLQLDTSPVGESDSGSFYTLVVQNTGPNPVLINSICVTDGAPDLGPNSCYFNNHSFTEGLSGWEVSEGVEPVDEGLNVPDDGVISQNVMLLPLPGGPATYRLVVRGNWWYTGALDTVSSASAIAQVQYEWPDGTGYQNMIPITIHGNLAYGAGQLAYAADIEVSSETDDLMNLKVSTTTAGDMDVQGIQITDACLRTLDGGPFPGQGGDGAPPPLPSSCEYVSRPQNNDPAAWLQWHWNKSEQFFKCDLMVLLNKMYTLGKQSYTLAGWEARYMQSSMRMWSTWLGAQLLPWFGGHFRNIAIGQVTTVYTTGGSCNDLFCVLNNLITGVLTPINNIVNTVLGLINTAANLLLTILTGVIGLGLSFLGRVFILLNNATRLLGGILTAYQTATPVSIEGFPTCAIDPESSLLCRAVWTLDNSILGGRWAVLITLILSISTIHLILWAVGEFKSAITKVGAT